MSARLVGEDHLVDVEVRRIGSQEAVGAPLLEGRPGPLVAIPRFGIAWENEPDGVLRMGSLQPCPALLVDDVVGRSGHGAEVGGERGELVAEAGKGEEFGHHGSPSG